MKKDIDSVMLLSSTSFAAKNFLVPHIPVLSMSYRIFLVCGDSQQDLGDGAKNAEQYRIEIDRKPSLTDFMAIVHYVRLAWRLKPRLILTITPKMALIALALKICLPKTLVGHYFTGQVWVEYTGIKHVFYKFLDKIFVRYLDYSLCDGIGQRQFLISQGICDGASISVLGSGSIAGVVIDCNQPIRSIEYMRSDPINLLYVGRLNVSKGLDDVLYVLERLLAESAHFNMTIVGPDEGGYFHKFRKLLIKYPKRIIYVGHVDDVSEYYASSHLLLLPSRREGFGSVVIEAAKHGVPTIAYDIYGLRGTIINNETGFLADAFEREVFYSLVYRLIKNRDEIERAGQRAFEYTKQHFSQDIVTMNLKKFIDSKIACNL